jgi:hypothetical protein
MRFREFIKMFEDEEDPMKRFLAMRTGVFGDTQKPVDLGIPQTILDIIAAGFNTGASIPPQIVRFLKLDGENYSLVADSSLVTAGGAYPFVREKRAGQHTGRIMFVRGYQFSRFLTKLKDLVSERK